MEFTDNEVAETKEISENIYLDLNREGNLVSMTSRDSSRSKQIRARPVTMRPCHLCPSSYDQNGRLAGVLSMAFAL
jgi:hypothetical protein